MDLAETFPIWLQCFIVSCKTTCAVHRFLNDWIWEREFSHTPKCRLWLTMRRWWSSWWRV
ncbi:hypothetical protein HanXRQr2_Chr17g0828111 [Helianthus annuus]|uniref:Uncharacterized protein n=1 Tax=Helianthus annuus TaxID=4232 RepID=A0A251RUS6_HELAN|nr:hypothetical protein HanXRQr2_Chr17g0828111 [Helianthus annuus]KAJ0815215.1 hypothetical protein HanPSC8_Chr17g0794971 [Helianthus annuus]